MCCLWPTQLLCPRDSPGKNTGVGSMPSSRGSTGPRDRAHISCVSCVSKWILYHWATWEAPSHRHTSLNKAVPVKIMSEKIWKKDHLYVTGPGWKSWRSFLCDSWKKNASKDAPFNKIIKSLLKKEKEEENEVRKIKRRMPSKRD